MDPGEEDSYGLADNDPFPRVVERLSCAIHDHVTIPYPLEKLKSGDHKDEIHSLVTHLATKAVNKTVIHALLCIRWHLISLQLPADDQRALRDTRAQVCEIIAARFIMRLSDIDAIEYCLHQLPKSPENCSMQRRGAISNDEDAQVDENSALLSPLAGVLPQHFDHRPNWESGHAKRSISLCAGLTALEIAVVAEAKHFLSRTKVQDITDGIWYGKITFEETGSAHDLRVPKLYNRATDSVVTRLKVPRYMKSFETVFYLVLFVLCCVVASQQHGKRITSMVVESVLYLWIASLVQNEISERIYAGSLFYSLDIWNAWDHAIIGAGVVSLLTRLIGLSMKNARVSNLAFDIICIEALFVLPRMCSMTSLYPYFGTLFPCLKIMANEFAKVMVMTIILFSGFYASFTLLCKPIFSLQETWWLLTKVFFGSGALGIDAMTKIPSPLAQPLMLLFIICSKILMMTVILCILRDVYVKIVSTAYDECIFLYSVFVLEASMSNRHTHFYPPLGLLPLVLLSPFQVILSQECLERLRYLLLKITHLPVMVLIWIFENVSQKSQSQDRLLRPEVGNYQSPKSEGRGTAYESLHLLRTRPQPKTEGRKAKGKPRDRRGDTEAGLV